MMQFKQQVHQNYLQLVQDRIDVFRDMIVALTDDSKNDAKGSAGDKHETALSMMHIEQEKLNQKLREFLDQKNILDKIDPEAVHVKIALGSLVKANDIHLYLSAALPKTLTDGVSVIALSPQSPLGAMLMGKQVGDAFNIGNTLYTINEIY